MMQRYNSTRKEEVILNSYDNGLMEDDEGCYYNVMEVDDEIKRLKHYNPCGHTGYESFVCEKCGYPDQVKYIQELEEHSAYQDEFLYDLVEAHKESCEERDVEISALKDRIDLLTMENTELKARIKELEEAPEGSRD